MPSAPFEISISSLPHAIPQTSTVTITLLHWHERFIAWHSQDTRLQAVLESEGDPYERIAALMFHKPVQVLSKQEKELGHLLVKAACALYGKRFISGLSDISPVKAQELLNKFYAVFAKAAYWVKRAEKDFVFSEVARLLTKAMDRCLGQLPRDWRYLGELRFAVPYDVYDNQVVKFFKHHFEQEIVICDELVHFEIKVELN